MVDGTHNAVERHACSRLNISRSPRLLKRCIQIFGLILIATFACDRGSCSWRQAEQDLKRMCFFGPNTISTTRRSLNARVARHAKAEPTELSAYHGVSWHQSTRQWQAHIEDPDTAKMVSLGLYASERNAAQAFDRASICVRGGNVTNFPADWYSEEELENAWREVRSYFKPRPSSQYYGVYQTRASGRWKAEIELYDIKQFLDFYDTEEEAAQAVDAALRSTRGEKALLLQMLNFKEDDDYFDEETWDEEPIPKRWSSRFLGVTFHQPSGQYLAKLGRKHIGLFKMEDEAAHAFDKASLAAGGLTNFAPATV